MSIENRYQKIKARYDELVTVLSQPDIFSDLARYQQIIKEHNDLEPVAKRYESWCQIQTELAEVQALMTSDDGKQPDMSAWLKTEAKTLSMRAQAIEAELEELMQISDPKDMANVYLEIRSGAGGEEAALFAQVLMQMYHAYAIQLGFQWEMVDLSLTELGGLKEGVFLISGQGAYSRFKYEMGVHRVQRVPVTESGGRIHTSTCTVAIMPEVDDVAIDIHPDDLQIDTYRASGAGGQHVNKTSSAIRITHKPTGVVVQCQDERSQHKNKDKAMKMLRSKLYDMAEQAQADAVSKERQQQVGTGDRSERIRTYNYHQSRVTDHRINLTLYKLDDILSGQLNLLVQPLMEAERITQMVES